MADLLLHTWPLFLPVPVLVIGGQLVASKFGRRAFLITSALLLAIVVATFTYLGIRGGQPLAAEMGAAVAAYAPTFAVIALLIDIARRRNWSAAATSTTTMVFGCITLAIAMPAALFVQGILGGDSL